MHHNGVCISRFSMLAAALNDVSHFRNCSQFAASCIAISHCCNARSRTQFAFMCICSAWLRLCLQQHAFFRSIDFLQHYAFGNAFFAARFGVPHSAACILQCYLFSEARVAFLSKRASMFACVAVYVQFSVQLSVGKSHAFLRRTCMLLLLLLSFQCAQDIWAGTTECCMSRSYIPNHKLREWCGLLYNIHLQDLQL